MHGKLNAIPLWDVSKWIQSRAFILLAAVILTACTAGRFGRTVPALSPQEEEQSIVEFMAGIEEEYRKGLNEITEGRIIEACDRFQRLSDEVTDNPLRLPFGCYQNAYLFVALGYHIAGDYAGGRSSISRALSVRGVFWDASWNSTTLEFIADTLPYSQEWPDNHRSEYYLLISRLFQLVEQTESSIEFARVSAGLDSLSGEKTYNLANILLASGEHSESLPVFERAIQLSPEQSEVWSDYGIALSAEGRPEAAVASLEKAVALNSDNQSARTNLVMTYYLSGRYTSADSLNHANMADFRDQRKRCLIVSAVYLLDEGHDSEAYRALRKAGQKQIYLEPFGVGIYAVVLEAISKHDKARVQMRYLLERYEPAKDPDFVRERWFFRRRVLDIYVHLLEDMGYLDPPGDFIKIIR